MEDIEAAFIRALTANPLSIVDRLVYADFLKEQGRDTEAAIILHRPYLVGVSGAPQILVRDKPAAFGTIYVGDAKPINPFQKHNVNMASRWFAAFPDFKVCLVDYVSPRDLGLSPMPVGPTGRTTRNRDGKLLKARPYTPLPDDPRSDLIYHRKGRGGGGQWVYWLDPHSGNKLSEKDMPHAKTETQAKTSP